MSENYSVDYWFNQVDNQEIHGGLDNFNEKFYGFKILKNLICNLNDIPLDGKIVLLGARETSIKMLCKHFGSDRVVGFDISNPTNHPNITVKNVIDLSDKDNFPIAFAYNDVGNFVITPRAKLHAQIWGAKNIIKGGYFLGRTNNNNAGYDLEGIMEEYNFVNYNLGNLENFQGISLEDKSIYREHLLSKRK